jgi:predicted CoA-binding protein
MASKQTVDSFIAQKNLAVVGVSRSGKKFGNAAYRELKSRGYQVYPIHPSAQTLEGDRAYAAFQDLPVKVGGVVAIVPPASTAKVVEQAHAAGIPRIWMQQGSESKEAIRLAQEYGMEEVHGECILMFSEPVSFGHRLHRWVKGLMGGLPK